MNIIVIPDAAMIVIPLIEKNGHTYLSPSNFSRYNNTSIYDGNFEYEKVFSSYMSSEVPSGVRGRLRMQMLPLSLEKGQKIMIGYIMH